MFDYVINEFNEHSNIKLESQKKDNKIYLKFSESPFFLIPKTYEEFKQSHKSKFWYNINRSEKLFNKNYDELEFKVLHSKEDLNYFLPKIFDLFNERWKDEYTSFSWKKKAGFKKYADAMVHLNEKKQAFLAVLYTNGELISFSYCLNNDVTIYFYQHCTTPKHSYRKYSLGKVFLSHLFKYIIDEKKFKKFDFMIGSVPYKLEWAKEQENVYIEIGDKTFINYFKYYILKVKYFLQFNSITREFLKSLLLIKEKYFG